MQLTKENLIAIERIYDVVTEPEKWTGVLENFDQQLGCTGSNVFVSDHTLQELTFASASTSLYPALEKYLTDGSAQIEGPAIGKMREIIPDGTLTPVSTVYGRYKELFDPAFSGDSIDLLLRESAGVTDRYTSPLSYHPQYIDVASFNFSAPPKIENIEFGNILLPHLGKAVELSRPFTLLQTRFRAVLDVLSRFHLGVFILSSSGRVIVENRAAERIIDLNDGLRLKPGKQLKAIDVEDDSILSTALASVISDVKQPKDHAAKRLLIKRNSNATPYIVEVSPLTNSNLDPDSRLRAILITIIDPDHHAIVDTTGLTQLFGLTLAEQQVCNLLVEGYSTNNMAESRNTSPETIRTQIKSLLHKTSSSHRAELVRLALSINIPVDQADNS